MTSKSGVAAVWLDQRCGTDRAFCDVPMGQTMGTCVLPKADDAPCQRNSDCDSQRCDPATLVCGPSRCACELGG